jgi:xylulose-5-phosphate/fructose-6-phosphate phosphoketolase
MSTSTVNTAMDTPVLSRYRGAADYLAAAMIFLRDNALLREPLCAEHLKPRLLGHWAPVRASVSSIRG